MRPGRAEHHEEEPERLRRPGGLEGRKQVGGQSLGEMEGLVARMAVGLHVRPQPRLPSPDPCLHLSHLARPAQEPTKDAVALGAVNGVGSVGVGQCSAQTTVSR